MEPFKIIVSILIFLIFNIKVFSQNVEDETVNSEDYSPEEKVLIEQLKNKPLEGMFGISFTNSVPQGMFHDNLQTAGPGFSIFGGYFAGNNLPFAIGAEIDFLFYGGDDKKWSYGLIPNKYEDTLSTSNIIIPLNLFARIQTDLNYVIPYFEVFGGITFINSSIDYKTNHGSNYGDNRLNVPFHYGFGVGAMFLTVNFISLPHSRGTMNFEFKTRYSIGDYSKYHTVKIKEETAEFNEHSSKTDLLTMIFGVTFRF